MFEEIVLIIVELVEFQTFQENEQIHPEVLFSYIPALGFTVYSPLPSHSLVHALPQPSRGQINHSNGSPNLPRRVATQIQSGITTAVLPNQSSRPVNSRSPLCIDWVEQPDQAPSVIPKLLFF